MASGKPRWLIWGLGLTGLAALWLVLSPADGEFEARPLRWSATGLVVEVKIHNRTRRELTYMLGLIDVTSDHQPQFSMGLIRSRQVHRLKPGGTDTMELEIPHLHLPGGLRLHMTRYRGEEWQDWTLNWLSEQAPNLETRRWIQGRIEPTAVPFVSQPFNPLPAES